MIEWTDELAAACKAFNDLKPGQASVLSALKALDKIAAEEPRMIDYHHEDHLRKILAAAPIPAADLPELKKICFAQLCEDYPKDIFKTIGKAIIAAEEAQAAEVDLNTSFGG